MTEEEMKQFLKDHCEVKVDGGKAVSPLYQNEPKPDLFTRLTTIKSDGKKTK